jgi:hypothetical protein
MRGVNDDELADLIEFGPTVPRGARSSSTWTSAARPDVDGTRCSRAAEQLIRRATVPDRTVVDADHRRRQTGYRLTDGTVFGHHRLHDRAVLRRLRSQPSHRGRTVVPVAYYARGGTDLAGRARGRQHDELQVAHPAAVAARRDRGAEERLARA